MKIKMHIRDDRYNLESFVCIFLASDICKKDFQG